MNTLSDQDWQLIEGKIREELDAAEISLFNEKMQHAAFKNAFETELRVAQGLLEYGDSALKKELHQFEEKHLGKNNNVAVVDQPKSNLAPVILRWLIIGLIAGLAAVLIPKAIQKNKSEQTPLKMAELYQPYPNTAYQIERSIGGEDILRDAFSAYENGNYAEAIKLFNIAPASLLNKEVTFYLGLSYFALKDYSKAKNTFNSISTLPDNELNEGIQYYKAICAYEQNQALEALDLLKMNIENSQSPYWESRSTQLLTFYESKQSPK